MENSNVFDNVPLACTLYIPYGASNYTAVNEWPFERIVSLWPVTGTVYDADGSPAADATVSVYGISTKTDSSGAYTVYVKPGDSTDITASIEGVCERSISVSNVTGALNNQHIYLGKVAAPTFTPASGTYAGTKSVTISAITPSITGNSVYRTNATTATVRFSSNVEGTCYYTVDGNPTTTVDALLLGFNAGAVTTNATTALVIDPALLSSGAKYVHIVVVDGSANASNILDISMPYNMYYFDDFEAYAHNTVVPANTVSITSSTPQMHTKYDGGTASNQKIILSDDNRVLQTIGTYARGLDIRTNLPSSIESGYAVFEADIIQTTLSDTAGTSNAGLILGKDDAEARAINVIVDRGTHKFVAQALSGSK